MTGLTLPGMIDEPFCSSGRKISAPADPFEAQASRDALVELSGALKVVAVSLIKIANDLASAGRTMSFNDLQTGAPHGEGEAKDRNVELLIDDPR